MAVYDADTPVTPAFEVRVLPDGRTFIANPTGADRLFKPGSVLACDIETVGVNEMAFQVKVITIGTAASVVAFDPRDPKMRQRARDVLAEAAAIVFHGGSFDVPPLVALGVMDLEMIGKVWDTLVLARLAVPDTLKPKTLSACASRYLGIDLTGDLSIKRAFKAGGYKSEADGFAHMDIDSPVYLNSAMMDTAITAQIVEPLWSAAFDHLTKGHPFADTGADTAQAEHVIEREQVVNRVMLRRNAYGLPVDLGYLDRYREQNEARLTAVGTELKALGIDPGNGNHLTRYLAEVGELPDGWPTTPGGALSAKAEHLEKLTHPAARSFLFHKTMTKTGTYLEQVERYARMTGRLHPQVGILGASATGRMAYGGGVPLQQFPAGARGIILADPGHELISVDWSSIEPILMANAAAEPGMIAEYEAGGDLYAPVMAAGGVSRKQAKVVLLAQMYGQGIDLLAKNLKVDNTAEAAAVRDNVMRAMPNIKRFLHQLKTIGNDTGMIVTISGRVLSIPKVKGQYAGYKAQNYFCQGSAYDVLAEAIYALEAYGISHPITLAMHDELVLSVPKGEYHEAHRIVEMMQRPPTRLCTWAKRTPVLRTDAEVLGERWTKPE